MVDDLVAMQVSVVDLLIAVVLVGVGLDGLMLISLEVCGSAGRC